MKKIRNLLVSVLVLSLMLTCISCGTQTPSDTIGESITETETEALTETETESEAETETEKGTETETESKADTESETESVTETESATETETETETEKETETVRETESQTEAITESETEPATEAVTEAATESETTPATEPEQEDGSYGLDITDKNDLVSICYSVWFDAILHKSGSGVDSWYNMTEAMEGTAKWGNTPNFHYWAKPALGYYSSSNKEVIRTHMTQLSEAGVDFIIIDLTNANDNYMKNGDWMSYVKRPMDTILKTIVEMREEGKKTPYVVFWSGESKGPLYKEIYDKYYAQEKWKDCFVYWNGKPFLLTTQTLEKNFPYKDLMTVRAMWGLKNSYMKGQWSFLNVSNYKKESFGKTDDGRSEQLSVAVASQETYMSRPTAHGRNHGIFWYTQWEYAFTVRPKVITLTWWNEWTAQRLSINGEIVFTDAYGIEYSRDIEPMEGGHGDQYYQWMKEYIRAYRAGEECPVLVEEGYEDEAVAEAKKVNKKK